MSTAPTAPSRIKTLADLLQRLGGVPLDRILFQPYPGTATLQDVLEVEQREGKRCELVAGALVEKAAGFRESVLTAYLSYWLNHLVISRNLGILTGPDGTVELMANLVRIPDVAFTRWERMPGRRRPTAPIPRLVPNLAIEVLSRSNTPGEMTVKRQDYFTAGVEIVWEIDPDARSVAVYTAPTAPTVLRVGDTLSGGTVLPGFALPVAELFAELDRQG